MDRKRWTFDIWRSHMLRKNPTFLTSFLCLLICTTVYAPAAQPDWVWVGGTTAHETMLTAGWTEGTPGPLAIHEQDDAQTTRMIKPESILQAEPMGAIARYRIDRLQPATRYSYGWDGQPAGTFASFPQGQADFTFAFASCATTGSNHPVFDAIADTEPLFFLHTGDFHYEDIAVNDPALFRHAFARQLTRSRQQRMFRSMPVLYIWDDHDYGPNDSDSRSPSRPAAHQAYREVVPHYPLIDDQPLTPIGQAFTIGRVRFIMPDLRTDRWHNQLRDGPEKTMMGAQQLAWFKQQLLEARDTHALIVFVTTVPWIDSDQRRRDAWGAYAHERQILSDFMVENNIDRVVALAGDAHMVAADDGRHNTFASDGKGPGFPIYHAAALHRGGSVKGGPYSEGTFPGPFRFGVLEVRDHGDSIDVTFRGQDFEGHELLSHQSSWSVPAP